MPRARFEIIGEENLRARIHQLEGEVQNALPAALMAGGLVLQNKWKRNIVAQGLVDTGTYLRSIHSEITRREADFAEVEVGTDITDPPYPDWLEHGTSQMEARPHARPAYDTSVDEIQAEVIDALKEVFVKYGTV